MHGSWDPVTGHHSALYPNSDETSADARYLTVDFASNYWIDNGFPKEKINLGLSLYGRTFTLKNPSEHDLGSPAKGAGTAGTVIFIHFYFIIIFPIICYRVEIICLVHKRAGLFILL